MLHRFQSAEERRGFGRRARHLYYDYGSGRRLPGLLGYAYPHLTTEGLRWTLGVAASDLRHN